MPVLRQSLFLLTLAVWTPVSAAAEQLKILQGDVSNPVRVSPGNDIIIESEVNLAQTTIANPSIADLNMKSGSEALLTGVAVGRTTLTLFDAQGNVRKVEVEVAEDAPTVARVGVPNMPSTTTASVSLVGTSSITVRTSGAIVIETDEPFSEISFEDNTFADGSALSDRSVYVYGKQVGTATLSLIRADSSDQTTISVRVKDYNN